MGAVTGGAIGAGAGHLAKANYGKQNGACAGVRKGPPYAGAGHAGKRRKPAAQHGIAADPADGRALVDPAAAAASRRNPTDPLAQVWQVPASAAPGSSPQQNPNQKNASSRRSTQRRCSPGLRWAAQGANLAPFDGDENRALGTLGGAAAGQCSVRAYATLVLTRPFLTHRRRVRTCRPCGRCRNRNGDAPELVEQSASTPPC